MGREMRDAVKALQQCRKPERPPTKKYTQDPMHREPHAENDSDPGGFGAGLAIIDAKDAKNAATPLTP